MGPQCTMPIPTARKSNKRPNPMRQGRIAITVSTIGQKKKSTRGPKVGKNLANFQFVATGGTIAPKIGKKQNNKKKKKTSVENVCQCVLCGHID